MVVLFVLCAIHASLAKPKWLWMNDEEADVKDSGMALRNAGNERNFRNAKRKTTAGKGCIRCRTGTCYGGKCVE